VPNRIIYPPGFDLIRTIQKMSELIKSNEEADLRIRRREEAGAKFRPRVT